jgi:hypothetical protein
VSERDPARSSSQSEWDRARLAYRAFIGDRDPVADLVRLGAVDLRPGGVATVHEGDGERTIVVSGPQDLAELREIVEAAIGVGTWPVAAGTPGEIRTVHLDVEGSGPLSGLLLAMEGLIDDRSPWRRWRSAVDTIAARIATLSSITIEALIIEPGG